MWHWSVATQLKLNQLKESVYLLYNNVKVSQRTKEFRKLSSLKAKLFNLLGFFVTVRNFCAQFKDGWGDDYEDT